MLNGGRGPNLQALIRETGPGRELGLFTCPLSERQGEPGRLSVCWDFTADFLCSVTASCPVFPIVCVSVCIFQCQASELTLVSKTPALKWF